MNARTFNPATTQAVTPRFDRKFIEEHRLLERYLEGKLPVKGARDLENWCRANPDYLAELNLSERAQASLKLLEASGHAMDLREPQPPWWQSRYVPIALAVLAALSLFAFWILFGKYVLLQGRLEDSRTLAAQGSLVQPTSAAQAYVTPDRASGIDRARIVLNRSAPQLLDVHVDLSYTGKDAAASPRDPLAGAKLTQYRMFVDKQGQGRALVLNNLVKDSNGELRITLNSTGLAAGTYAVRIEELPFKGSPFAVGYLLLEVH